MQKWPLGEPTVSFYRKNKTEANQALEPTTMAVTLRAPSRTKRASHGRGSSLTFGKNMKSLAIVILCLVFSGCLSYRPDQRVVGRFQAVSGEVIDIRSDGAILFVSEKKDELVGLVSISKEDPLSIHVVGPDISRLVGTKIIFSADRSSIAVAWPDWQKAKNGIDRPTEFQNK